MRKTIFLFIFTIFSFFLVFSVQASEITDLVDRVRKVQETIPSATPLAPTGFDQKGFVGEILKGLFNASGEIKGDFIEAFASIWKLSSNNIPRWTGTRFAQSSIWEIGGNIGIGTTLPTSKLFVAGDVTASGAINANAGISNRGKVIVSPSGNAVIANGYANDNYGFFAVNNLAGNRGAYFGYGDGEDRVSLALDNASILGITGGNVGIETTYPTQALDVNGKIRMRSQTADADPVDTVVTKGYVDYKTESNMCAICIKNNATGEQKCGVDGEWSLPLLTSGTLAGGGRTCRSGGRDQPDICTTAPITGSPQSLSIRMYCGEFLTGGDHTDTDCTDAGGTTLEVSPGVKICRFNITTANGGAGALAVCPSSWKQYQNWSTAVSATCSNDGSSVCGVSGYGNSPGLAKVWSNNSLVTGYYSKRSFRGLRGCTTSTPACNPQITQIGCY